MEKEKRKKGFTLIELLAVIVILAVIMVIAVPQILNVIEKSKESAASSSIKLVKDAIKTQVSTASMSGVTFAKTGECYEFNFDNQESGNAKTLSLKNKDQIGGSIKYCNGKFESDTLTFDGTSVSSGETPAAPVPKYFAFGTPTTSSTTDWTTLGKNVFATLTYGETTGGVCINDGGLFCIKANDYENSKELLKAHFGESNCSAGESDLSCNSDDFNCSASSYGFVYCYDASTHENCYAYADGTFYCAE